MTAAGGGGAGAARSLSRFRGCLAGALLGDCVGAVYEAHDTVSLTSVLNHVESLEPDPGTPGSARTGGRGTTDRVPTPGRGDPDSGARARLLADEAAELEAPAAGSVSSSSPSCRSPPMTTFGAQASPKTLARARSRVASSVVASFLKLLTLCGCRRGTVPSLLRYVYSFRLHRQLVLGLRVQMSAEDLFLLEEHVA